MSRRTRGRRALLALLPLLAACSPKPAPIVVGSDTCEHCQMAVADPRFAAELVTRKGRVYRFDSVECLATFYRGEVDPGDVHSLWVTDALEPAGLIRVEDARFVHGDALHTPMGAGLAAFRAERSDAEVLAAIPGEILSWAQLLERVGRGLPGPGAGHAEPREVTDATAR